MIGEGIVLTAQGNVNPRHGLKVRREECLVAQRIIGYRRQLVIDVLGYLVNDLRLPDTHIAGDVGKIILALFDGFFVGRGFLWVAGDAQQQRPAVLCISILIARAVRYLDRQLRPFSPKAASSSSVTW